MTVVLAEFGIEFDGEGEEDGGMEDWIMRPEDADESGKALLELCTGIAVREGLWEKLD